MTEPERYRVLLIEDNALDARTISRSLTAKAGCEVHHFEDLTSGLEALQNEAFDCVLLDLSLPDSEGLVSVETVVARSPHCPVVVLTGLDDPEVAVEAVERGAQDYLVKNTMTSELVVRAIRYAVARHSAETELRGATDRLNTMHAREQIARDLHDTVIQRLFATGMSLQAATRLPSRDAIVDRALGVVDEIDAAIRELREAIFGLNSLDEFESLAIELTEIAEGYRDGFDIEPVVRLGTLPPLPEALRADVRAVVREAFSNVVRHANATTATLSVTADGRNLMVRVTDNGVGTASLGQSTGSADLTGNGLNNMATRAEAYGGTMAFSAGPNGGSELVWSVPLPR